MIILLKYKIEQLKDTNIPLSEVEDFLLKHIKNEYNLDYTPEYHRDIKYLYEYYVNPERNNFYIATNLENNKIIGTIGIREYDVSCQNFPNSYVSLLSLTFLLQDLCGFAAFALCPASARSDAPAPGCIHDPARPEDLRSPSETVPVPDTLESSAAVPVRRNHTVDTRILLLGWEAAARWHHSDAVPGY